ncbi:MAG: radical SAM protein [Defluviitaleaceae bacterium]|nr:radical SAM protein [Defluviitaleaceae bacterium]
MNSLRIYGFTNESVVDGPGIRVVVFVQGCDNACEHCHNPDSWDMSGGEEYGVKDIIKKIKKASGHTRNNMLPLASNGYKKAPERKVTGVTFSGGEPFLQATELAQVAEAVKKLGLDITTYTGNTYEKLSPSSDEGVQALLSLTDYLIDGRYIHEKRDISLKFRGSSNQRIIDMNKTRAAREIVLFSE